MPRKSQSHRKTAGQPHLTPARSFRDEDDRFYDRPPWAWLSYLALAAFCVLASASYLGLESYAGFWPARSQAFLVRFRTWMDHP